MASSSRLAALVVMSTLLSFTTTIRATSLRGALSLAQDVDNMERHEPGTERRLESATFENPKVKDLPIDHCLRYQGLGSPEPFGVGCGEPVATRFCNNQGFMVASDYVLMYYAKTATYILGMDDINPASDAHQAGKGSHTFFGSISCAEPHDG